MIHAERRLGFTLAAMTVAALGLVRCSTPPAEEPDAGGGGEIICSGDTDCPAGFVCYGAVCAPECHSNADCVSGLCNLGSGACEVAVEPSDAGPYVDAGPSETVDGGGGGTPDGGSTPDAGGGIVTGAPCPSPMTKYDCGPGLICKGNPRICQLPKADNSCSADLDCPSGKICNFSKQCEVGCSLPADCAQPLLCHPNKFICEKCSLTNPCPAGNSCIGESCVAATACTSTAQCNGVLPGSVCKAGKCANCESHSDCREAPYTSENRVCSTAGICEKVTCSDANCKRDMNSQLAYCDTTDSSCKVRECLADSDCATNPNGSICNTATNTCTAGSANCTGQAQTDCDTQCGTQGLACNYGTCTCGGNSGPGVEGDPCVATSDCATGYACGLGICSEAAVLPDGSPCPAVPFLCAACVSAVSGTACDIALCSLTSLFGSILCL